MKSFLLFVVCSSLILSACSNNSTEAVVVETSPTPAATVSPTPEVSEVKEPAHPISLPGLMEKNFSGSDLTLGKIESENASYTRYQVTYQSGEFNISGIMNIPKGEGPFPALVLGHGYIDPKIYTTGRGLRREQDYLAKNGFIVLHTDYRNHATSDDDPNNMVHFRLGYTDDVINAALAMLDSDISQIDKTRIGYLGRSMGGGIGYNVAVVKPDLFDAIVLFAPVSPNYMQNFNRWGVNNPERYQPVYEAYGTPDENPEFWSNLSAENFYENVNDPILILHGTLDDTCDLAWSEKATSEMQALGKDIELITYPDGHAFGPYWTQSMVATVEFLNKHLNYS
jgi:uncharacterized protein